MTKNSFIAPIRPYFGVLAILHELHDYPEFSGSINVIQSGVHSELSVVPTVVISTDDIRDLAVESRNCWFHDERNLGYSDRYSFQNCLSECRAQMIVKFCNCMPFYYPKIGMVKMIKLNHTKN